MTTERDVAKTKVAKLLALGTSLNSAEATVALAKAQQIMSEWSLSITDIELGDEKVSIAYIEMGKQSNDTYPIYSYLGSFLGVKTWLNDGYKNKVACAAGYEQDLALFKHFVAMFEYTFESELKAWQKTEEYKKLKTQTHGRKLRINFRTSFNNTMMNRLYMLTRSNVQKTSTGTEIIPLKMANIKTYLEEEAGMKFRKASNGFSHGYGAGSDAGLNAAKKVSFNTPVTADADATKLLSNG